MTTVYKILGVLPDGEYCSAVLWPSHPASMRYRLGKTTRAPKNMPIMAFDTIEAANTFSRTGRDLSTPQQVIAQCEATVVKAHSHRALHICDLYDPKYVADYIAYNNKMRREFQGSALPTGTVLCTTLKVVCIKASHDFVSQYAETYDVDLTHYKTDRLNFLKSVSKYVRQLTKA